MIDHTANHQQTEEGSNHPRFLRLKELITVWWSSSSVEEVAEKLGWDEYTVANRAKYLRGLGIVLKQYLRGKKGIHGPHLSDEDKKALARHSLKCSQKAPKFSS